MKYSIYLSIELQSRIYHKIYEEYYKIEIPKGMHIHHIDGNRANNDPKNLLMVSPEDHCKIHMDRGDIVALNGKFIQGASEAGKKGGKSRSDKKINACVKNMNNNRRSDLGAKASVESRKKNKTFFFSKEYQKSLQDRLRETNRGQFSENHKMWLRNLNRENKGKRPRFGNRVWISSYDAFIDSGVPSSTIRYRCRNNTLGWSYDKTT